MKKSYCNFNNDTADAFIDIFSKTSLTMRKICELIPGKPDVKTIRDWAHKNLNGFGERFDAARPLHAQAMIDDIDFMIDDIPVSAWYIDAQGNKRIDSVALKHIDMKKTFRQWLASKELEKYSDKQQIKHTFEQHDDAIKSLFSQVAEGNRNE